VGRRDKGAAKRQKSRHAAGQEASMFCPAKGGGGKGPSRRESVDMKKSRGESSGATLVTTGGCDFANKRVVNL